MNNQDIQLTTKLIQLTIENTIKWEITSCPNSLIEGTDLIVPIYFQTHYNESIFAIYKIRYQQYSMEFDQMYWSEDIKLAVVKDNTIIWENTKSISAINNLFIYVQEQASGINNIIKDLI